MLYIHIVYWLSRGESWGGKMENFENLPSIFFLFLTPPHMFFLAASYIFYDPLYIFPGDPHCGSPPGVKMADTLTFTAKVDMVDFWV